MPGPENNAPLLIAGAVGATLIAYVWWSKKAEEKKKSATLYERLGGDAAVNAAVDIFYKRVLSDPKINYFFKNTDMALQHKKQKAFMSYAFGAPTKYTGLAMDVAHRKLVRDQGMNDSHFDAVAGHLQATLEELKVDKALINEVMTAVGGLREQVMCRGKWAA